MSVSAGAVHGVLSVGLDGASSTQPQHIDNTTNISITVNTINQNLLVNNHPISLGGGAFLKASAVTSIIIQDNISGSHTIDLSAVTATNGFTNTGGVSVQVTTGVANDTILGSGFADTIDVGSGNVTFQGGGGNDLLSFSSTIGTDSISNTGGSVTFDLSGVSSNVDLNLQTHTVSAGTGTIDFVSSELSNAIGSSTTSNTFQGLDQTSTWNFGAASDSYSATGESVTFSEFHTVDGGTAGDSFYFNASNSLNVHGGQGNDLFSITSGVTTGDLYGSTGTNNLSAAGGTFTLAGGTFTLESSTALSSSSNVTLNSPAELDLNGFNETIGTLNGSGAITDDLGGATNVLTVASGGAFSGNISDGAGQLAFTIDSPGQTLTLSGDNSYSGLTSVEAGTLQLGSATALNSTSAGVTVSSGAALDLDGQAIGPVAVSLSGTGISNSGALINSTGSASLSGNVTLAADASIGGAGNLTLTGTVDAASANAESLTIVGTGSTTFQGIIGGTNLLSGLQQTSTAGTVEFDQNVNLGANGATLNGSVILGGIQFSSEGDVTFGSSSSNTLMIDGQATTVQSSLGSITLNSVTTTDQDATFSVQDSAGLLTVNGSLTANSAASLTLTSLGSVAIDTNVMATGTGAISITGDTNITIASTASISMNGTHNQFINLSSDSISLEGTINAGQGTVAIKEVSNGTVIDLGGPDVVKGSPKTLGLSAAELSNISAWRLDIGDVNAGQIVISSDVDLTGTSQIVHLSTGSTVTGTAGGISANNLAINANGAVNLTNADTSLSAVAVSDSTDDIHIVNQGSLNVGSIDAVNGISTSSGSIALTVSSGNLTVQNSSAANDLSATTGITIALNGTNDSFSTNSGANVTTTSGGVAITADNVTLNGTLTATGQTVSIDQSTNGQLINLGASSSAGTLGLTNGSLNNITANLLTIGNQQSGAITVGSNVDIANVNTLHLTTGSSVTGTAGGITVNNLAITAASGVDMTSSGTGVGTVAIATTSGSVQFTNSGNLDVGSVDGVNGISTGGGSVGLTIQNGSLTVLSTPAAHDISATMGITIGVNGANDSFTVNTGANVNTTSGGMTIAADNVTLNGTLTASGQTVAIAQSTNGQLINLGAASSAGTLGLTSAELNQITASVLEIGNSNSGAVTVSASIAPKNINALHLTSGSTVTASTGNINVNQLAISAGSNVTLSSSNTTVGTLAAASSNGSVNVNYSGNLNIGSVDGVNGVSAAKSSVSVTVQNGNLTVQNTAAANDVSGATGVTVSITGANDQFTVASGANVNSTAGGITITADQVTLNGTLTASGQTVTIDQTTNGQLINLGAAGSTGTLGLTNAELNNITANLLRVGNQQSGAVSVSANVDPTSVNALHLSTGAGVTSTAGGITTSNLAISANGPVTLTAPATNLATIAIQTSTGNITVNNPDSLVVGTVDGVTGVSTSSGSIGLTTQNGNLTVQNTAAAQDLSATTGITVSLLGTNNSFTVNSGANVATTSGGIAITADEMAFSGTLNASGQTVTIDQLTNGQLMNLGAASSAGTLGLTNTSLSNITANLLTIGNQQSGTVTVSSNVAAANVNTLNLTTGSNVTGTSGGIAVSGLAITAASGVDMTSSGSSVGTLAISTTSGSIQFTNSGNLNVGSVERVKGVSTGAGSVGLTVQNGNLTILDTPAANDVSATTGISIAVTGANHSFAVDTGANVNTTSGGMTIAADNVTLNGTLTASGQTVAIAQSTNGQLINLGTASSAGTLGLTNTELNQITANVLEIGNSNSGALTVSSNISPAIFGLIHLTSGSTVTASAGSININQLAISAGSNVTLSSSNTSVGTLAVASSNGSVNVSYTGNLTVGAVDGVNGISSAKSSVSVTVQNGNLTVEDTPAAHDISAATGIALSVKGANDQFTVESGANVITTSGTLAISADQVTLDGTLTATGQTVSINQTTNGQLINLGAASSAGTLGLTNAELNNITANLLRIGNQQSGAVTVSTDIDPSGVNSLHLYSGAGVTSTAGGITSSNLAISANSDVTLTAPATNLATIAVQTSTGNITVNNPDSLVVGTVDGVKGVSTGSGSVDVTIQNGNLTVQNTGAAQDISATTGIAVSLDGTNNGFTVNSGASVTTTSGGIAITADNVTLNGTLTAVGQTVSIDQLTNGQLIKLGSVSSAGTLGLTNTSLSNITSDLLAIGNQQSGAITVTSNVAAADVGTLSLTTGSSVTGTAGGIAVSDLAIAAANGVNMTSSGSSVGTVAIVTTTGSVQFTSSGNLNVGSVDGVSGVSTGAGSVGLTVQNGDLTITDSPVPNDVSATTGITIAINGTNDQFTVDSGANVNTTSGGMAITADNVTLNGALTASGQTVAIAQSTNGQLINLGAASSAGTLGLTNAELNQITANMLEIGNSNSGAVTVSTDIGPLNFTTLHLMSGSSVTASAGGIDVNQLAISAGNTITLNSPDTSVGTLAATTSGGSVNINYTGNLSIGTVDGVNGVSSAAGSVGLTVQSGNLTVENTTAGSDVSAATGVTVSITGANDQFLINSGANVSSTSGGVVITANQVALDGTVTASGQTVTIDQATNGELINLGSAGSAGTLGLTNAELNQITANLVRIGNLQSGALTVSSDIAPTHFNSLHLTSGSSVTSTAGGISITNLAVTAQGPVALTSADTNLSAIAIHSTTGNVTLINQNSLNVGSVDGVNGISTAAGSIGLTVSSGNLTVQNSAAANDLSATTGIAISLSGANDRFTINSGASVATTSGGVAMTADEVAFSGTLNASGQTVTIEQATNGQLINLGTASSAGTLGLTNGSLSNITADLLTIGNQQSGAITVSSNVAAADVNTLHLTTGSSVTGAAGGITVSNLAITAADGVNMTSSGSSVGTVAIATTNGPVQFTNSGNLDVGSVDGVNGISTGSGSVGLTVQNGGLTVLDTPAGNDFSATAGVSIAVNSTNNSFTVDSGANVNTTSGGMTITADNVTLNGTLTASGQTVAIAQSTNGQLINLGAASSAGTLGLTNAQLNQITANVLEVGNSNSGALSVSSDIAPANISTLHLESGSSVTGSTGAIDINQLAVTAAGNITLTSSTTNVGTLAATTSGGSVNVNYSGNLNIGSADGVNGVSSATSSVRLTVQNGNLTVQNTAAANDISAATGVAVSVTGANDQFTVASGANVNSTAGGITITADQVTLNGTLTASGQTVTIDQTTNGQLINLGAAGSTGTLGLTNAELNNITANLLRVGNQQSGAVSVSANVDPTSVNALHLSTGAGVTSTAGGITTSNLAISANGPVTLTAPATNLATIAIQTSTGNITVNNPDSLVVGTVDGVTGVSTSSGSIGLTTQNGNLTVQNTSAAQDLSATTGITVSLLGTNKSFTVNSGANVTTTSGGIAIIADNVTLNGSLNATGQTVSIDQSTNGQLIDLGVASSAGTLGLTNTSLNNISANLLTIGNQQSGAITVGSSVDVANVNTVHLTTGSSVTDTAGGITVNNLAITAAGGVVMTSSNSSVGTLAIASTSGSIQFTNSGNLNVGSVDGVNGVGTGAGSVGLTVQNGSLTVLDAPAGNDVSATTGITIAVNGANDSLTINSGANVNTTSGGMSITADNVTLNGTLTASGQTVAIAQASSGQLINLGAASSAGTLGFTNAELNQITASVLEIGNSNSGAVTVSANVAPTTINALHLTSGSSVTTSAGGIDVNQLAISAANNVTLTSSNTTVGTLAATSSNGSVNVNYTGNLNVGAVDGVNGISSAKSSVTVTVQNGNLTVENTSAAHDITAATGVAVSIAGANDQFTVNSGASVNTSAGGITITADNVALQGALLASGQTVTIDQTTNGQLINLGAVSSTGTLGLTNAELNNITANLLRIGNQQSGAITVSANIDPTSVNALHLSTGAGVTSTAGGITSSNLAISANGPVTLTAPATNLATIAIQTSAGNISINNLDNLVVGTVDGVSGVGTGSGSVNLTTQNGNLTVQNTSAAQDLAATTGIAVSLLGTNNGFTVNSGANVTTTSGGVAITADNVTLNGTLTATGQTVSIDQSTNGQLINLGASSSAGTLGLTNGSLNNITANLLTIGNQQSGAITVGSNVDIANVNTLHLTTGSSVTGTAGGITVNNLAITAASGVDMTSSGTGVGTVAIATTSGSVQFTNSGNLDVGSVDGVNGISTGGGSVGLTIQNGSLTVLSTPAAHDISATMGITIGVNGANDSFTVNTGANVNTTSGGMTIAADNVTLNGTLTASGQTVAIAQSTNGQLINLGAASSAGTLGLTNAELNQITASVLEIGNSNSGAVTVSASIAPKNINALHLTSGSTVTASTGNINVNQLAISAGSNVTLSSSNTTVGTLAAASSNGSVNVNYSGNLNIGSVDGVNGVSAAKSSVSVTVQNGNLTVQNTAAANDVSGATGVTVSITGANDQFTVASGANVNSTAGGITVTADQVTLNGTLTASGQTVTIDQTTNGQLINLGGAGSTGTLGLTNAELNNVTANLLRVGNQQSGAVSVSANVDPTSVNALHLSTGAGVTSTAGGITTSNLAISANGAVTLTAPATNLATIAIQTSTGNITLNNPDSLVVGTVDGVMGVSTSSGSIGLTTQNGNLTVQNTAAAQDLSATTGITVSLLGTNNSFTVNSGANVATTSGGIAITADNVTLNGALTATGQTVSIDQSTNGQLIDLGVASSAGTLGLTNTSLNNISANLLTIGNQQSGAITVGSSVDVANVNTVHLTTGSSVTGTSGGITVNNLAITAANGVNVTSSGSNVGTLAIASMSGSVQFTNSGNLNVGSVDGVNGISTGSGAVGITVSHGNLTILDTPANNDVSATTGITITLNGANESLTVNSGANLKTTTGGIAVIADNVTLNGTLTASGQTVAIAQSTSGQLINLGAASSAGTLGLTNSELNNITANLLTIGNQQSGDITFSANVNPTNVNIVHLTTGSGVTGTAGGITVGQLAISANNDAILTSANTNVGTVAIASSHGSVEFSNASGLVVGAVDGVSGVNTSSSSGNIALETGGATSLQQAINAGSGIVRISVATGGLSQTSQGTITGSALGVINEANGNVVLTSANHIGTFSADNLSSGGVIQLVDASGLKIGAVSSLNSVFEGTTGVETTNGNLSVQANGSVNLIDNVSVGTATARFQTTGGLTQTSSGTITAQSLGLINLSSGNISLNANNQLQTLAVTNSTTGQISFNDASALTIGSVTADGTLVAATTGITTGDSSHVGGDITIQSSGTITANQAVTTTGGAGGSETASGSILNAVLTAGAGNINLKGGGLDLIVNVNQMSNNDLTYTAQRDILINATVEAASDISLTSGRNMTLGAAVTSDNGSIDAQATGQLTSNAPLLAGDDLTLTSGGSLTVTSQATADHNVTLDSTAASVAIQAPVHAVNNLSVTAMTTIDASAALMAGHGITIDSGGTTTLESSSSLTSGAGGVSMTVGQLTDGANITTSSGSISITGPVLLSNSVAWVTNSSGSGANITVTGSIDGTVTNADNLTLTSGSGNVDVTGNVGVLTPLGNVLISQANDTTFGGSLNASSFQQLASTKTTFDGAVVTTGTVLSSGTDGFQFTGHSLQFAAGSSSLDSHGHNITITSDAITLPTTFVNATGKTVTIQTLSHSTSIGLEDASQSLDFTNTQLNVVHASNVVIGQTGNTGGIKVGTDGPVSVNANYMLITATDLNVNGLLQLNGANSLTANIGHDIVESATGHIQTGSGNISLTANHDLTQSGTIQTTSGATTLNVAGQVSLESTAQTLSTDGSITITAGTAMTAGDDTLNMSSGSVINAGSGQIALTGAGDTTLSQVITTNNSSNAIRITSQTGAIINGNSTATSNIVDQSSNGLVTLTAVTGVGSAPGAAIDTNLTNLSVVNSSNDGIAASGNVQINDVNPNGFAIKSIDQNASGNVSVTSQGTMVVTDPSAGGSGVHSQAGSITLTANNSSSNLDIRSSIDSTGGNISLNADDSIILGTAGNGVTGQINSSGGNISLIADRSGTSTGQVFMRDGSAIISGSGTLAVQAQGNIILSHIVTTNATSAAVTLVSRAGGLVDGGNSAGDNIDANAIGALTTIETATNIGSQTTYAANPALQTNIYEVNITNGSVGSRSVGNTDINLNEADNLIIQQLTQNQPGAVNITTHGELDVLSTGTGVTSTTGPINLTASGAGGNVDIEGAIQSTDAAITVNADQNVLMGPVSTIASAGANISVVAGAGTTFSNQLGGITMLPGATILGDGGTVSLVAQRDILLGQVISDANPNTLVSIDSKLGGIVSGNQSGINDVTAGSLALRAATGIGSDQPLQIDVNTVSAQNLGSGNIELNNTSAAPLVLGSVGGLVGLTNAGPLSGDIDVTNGASIQIQAPVENSSGGSITLIANGTSADINLHSRLSDSNGSGSINLDAGHNIEIFDTVSSPEIQVQNNGYVNLTAANQVIFDPNVQVLSGTGSIVDAPPRLVNVVTPEQSSAGLQILTLDFGRPGESNYTVTIYWVNYPTPKDSPQPAITVSPAIQTFTYPSASGPQSMEYTQVYHASPNAADPAAPIEIMVMVTQDPHINVTENAASQNSISATSFAQVPGTGIEVIAFDTTPEVVYLTISEGEKFVEVVHQNAVQIADNSTLRIETVAYQDSVPTDRRILFEVLSPDGSVLQRVEMPESVLDDMQEVISKLPDGAYRFLLQEPGEERQRLLLEFQVRQGKIFDGTDRSNRLPSNLPQMHPSEDAPLDEPADALKAIEAGHAEDSTSLELPVDPTPVTSVSASADNWIAGNEREIGDDEIASNRWTSLAVRRAWKQAERLADASNHDGLSDEYAFTASGSDELNEGADEEPPTRSSVMIVSAATVFAQASEFKKSVHKTAARLSRAARLFRKTTNKPR